MDARKKKGKKLILALSCDVYMYVCHVKLFMGMGTLLDICIQLYYIHEYSHDICTTVHTHVQYIHSSCLSLLIVGISFALEP